VTLVQSLVTELHPGLSHYLTSANLDSPWNLLVHAPTGTGKILAFLIPAVESRLKAAQQHAQGVVQPSGLDSLKLVPHAVSAFRHMSSGPLILSPMQELAIQIENRLLEA